MRTVVLYGASGQIGSGILEELSGSGERPVITVPWQEERDQAGHFMDPIDRLDAQGAYDFVFSCGLTDPGAAASTLKAANLDFPLGVIQRVRSRGLDSRFITLGTVMEYFPQACESNPYLKSKRELGLQILGMKAPDRFRHIRLHTIYGGERRHLKAHMFLGQIVSALQACREFQMSSGDQLREYHDVRDISRAISVLLKSDWNTPDLEGAVIHLSHARPCKLKDLALAIFEAFGKADLLKIGAIAKSAGENLDRVFPATIEVSDKQGPVHSVVSYLKGIL